MSAPSEKESGAEEHVLGDDGRFHAVDEEVRLSVYGGEDWIVLAVFWALAAVVFYQVFTRYVLNDAAGWTEEIARYLLVAVTFLGGAMAVRRNTHIQVDFVYRFLPRAAGRALSIFVDVVRAAFLGYAVWLTWLLMAKIGSQRMAIVELPIGLVFGAMLAGLPVALAMATASLAYVMLSGAIPDFVVIHRMYGGIDSFPLLAVPFFILAGNLMNSAGITNRIYNFALALVGWLKGGLGHVNIVGSMIFAGMLGTAIADAAGLGTIEIKAMKDHGYPIDFSVGVTAASATLGPIIPPSLPFVIYGMLAGVSIGQLFLAGVIPGIVMGLFMMATVTWYAHRRNYGR